MPFIYEFLYRGPTAQNNMQSDWHVILGDNVQSFGKSELMTKGPLTPAQAAADGFPLSAIIQAINTETMRSLDEERKAHEETKRLLEEKTDEHAKLAEAVRVATVHNAVLAADKLQANEEKK